MDNDERRDYRKLYAEDDGPLYEPKPHKFDKWDWVILSFIILFFVAFACSPMLIMF